MNTAEVVSPGSESSGARRRPVARKSLTVTEETKRYEELIEAAAAHAPPRLVPVLRQAAPVLAIVAAVVNKVAPVLITVYSTAFKYFNMLPHDLMTACFGLALCFCGGVYPAAIAAAEAFRMYGWESTKEHLLVLYAEQQRLRGVNAHDDTRDDDGDGIVDVDQVSGRQLFTRKLQLFLSHADPQRMNAAVGGLWQATLGVIGVLKIEFAKTITLGAAIGDTLSKTLGRFAIPMLTHLVPAEYRKWTPVLVNWVCKSIGMSIAWFIQRILSAAHSAIRGGFMCARSLLKFGARRFNMPFDDKDSYVDEALGFVLAAIGFYAQMRMGFGLPWFFDIILFPLHILEYVIEYTVSS